MAATRKVLVIDDDAAACGQIEEVLARMGLEVLLSSDPRAGIESAKSHMPDLIFINLLLSGTNGLKMSKAIHAVQGLENVPVIMLISHQGELDPKYTVTIGILDTLVKPLRDAEIIAKTKALLGDFAIDEPNVEAIREISLEEVIDPMFLHEEDEMIEESELASAIVSLGEPVKAEDAEQHEKETMSKMTKEGESDMPEKENLFDRKEDDDRDLFTDEADMFGEELKKSRADRDMGLKQEEDDHFPEDEVDLSYEHEKSASPVRRILVIAASIVVGIGLGVGGYLFFTAGSKQTPVEKQIVKARPEPAPVPVPAPAAIPSDKPNVIPEIPVKSEPQKSDAAQTKEAKPHEALPKSEAKREPVQKAEAEKSGKETASVSAAKSDEKKLLSPKQTANKTPTAIKGKRAYYVQTGFFENETNAKAMADKLKEKGFTPQVMKVEAKDDKVMFRVTAGAYSSFKKAIEVSETLSKQGLKAIVHKQ